MIFGVVAAVATLGGPAVLVLLDRRGERRRPATVVLGGFGGALAGAGVLIGAFHQSTTAYIDSGYSFASVVEWVVLAVGGGVAGALVGAALGWIAPGWRGAVVLLVLLGGAGAAGWIVDSSRPTIDCEERPAFCDERYG